MTADGVEFRSHLDGSKHFFSPEHSMAVQIALGADVMMVFDECVETPATWERTRDWMGLTHAWAARRKEYFEEHKTEVPWARGEWRGIAITGCRGKRGWRGRRRRLFGIVQGGMYADLRRESAERLVEMELSGVCDRGAGGGGAAGGDAGDDCAVRWSCCPRTSRGM